MFYQEPEHNRSYVRISRNAYDSLLDAIANQTAALATKEAEASALKARVEVLEGVLQALLDRIDDHFGSRPEWDWKEQADARAALQPSATLTDRGEG